MYGEDEEKGINEEKERQNSDMVEGDAVTAGLQLGGDDRDPNLETRPPRVRLQGGKKLAFEDVEFERGKFHYYAFLDDPGRPGRINNAKAAYWETVYNVHGQPATRPAGQGTHVLMKLPLKYWKEDLDFKKQQVTRRMATKDTEDVVETEHLTIEPTEGQTTTSDNP